MNSCRNNYNNNNKNNTITTSYIFVFYYVSRTAPAQRLHVISCLSHTVHVALFHESTWRSSTRPGVGWHIIYYIGVVLSCVLLHRVNMTGRYSFPQRSCQITIKDRQKTLSIQPTLLRFGRSDIIPLNPNGRLCTS